MASRYIPNITRSGTGVKQQTIDKARADGFKMAILAGAIVLNDIYDFPDEDIECWMNRVNELIGSISVGADSAKYLIRALEEMTNITVDFD